MAKSLMWYKNIKPGDVLEVEFLPGHLFFKKGSEGNKQKILITKVASSIYMPHGPAFYGNLFAMDCKCINQLFVDFNDSSPKWNQAKFLRKIKLLDELKEWDQNKKGEKK